MENININLKNFENTEITKLIEKNKQKLRLNEHSNLQRYWI